MPVRNSRKAYLLALLLAAPLAFAACGDDEGSSDNDDDQSSDSTSSSSSAASASGGQGGAGQGGAGQGGAGGADCVPGGVPAKTIKGTVSFTGTAKMGDSLRIVAFKDGMPGGAPAGYVFTDAMTPPTFPYAYELKISLPPEGTGQFSIIAYLDIGSNNVMGPGQEDPGAMPSQLVTVDDCKGAIVDVTLMAP